MANPSASTLRRSQRDKPIISYKNTVGAIAPPTTLGTSTGPHGGTATISKQTRDVKTTVLNLLVEGDKLEVGCWCCHCRNGGTLMLCSECRTNALCDSCLDFSFDTAFQCPPCFLKHNQKEVPYPFTLLSPSSTRENWPKTVTEPVAIISIRLEGLRDTGTPSVLTYETLFSWLHGNVIHFDIDFNLDDPTSQASFQTRLNKMISSFTKGQFKKWKRFFVFLTTHSDPRTGFLHIGPNNSGSVPASELLDFIFPLQFQTILKRSTDSVFSLLACGAVSKHPDSRNAIQDLANKSIFRMILAYTQEDLQPYFTNSFVAELAVQGFIYDRWTLANVLRDRQDLGAHTGVLEYKVGELNTFHWSHAVKRPLGQPALSQCPDCHRLKPWKVTVNPQHSMITLTCHSCPHSIIHQLPDNATWPFGPPDRKDPRGAWLRQTEAVEGWGEGVNNLDEDEEMEDDL